MQESVSQYGDILSTISSYLPPAQSGRLAQTTRSYQSVLSVSSVFHVAMERGYPYYKDMTMRDLNVYENTPVKDMLYQAALTNDTRVVHYWLDHLIGADQDTIDRDDVKIVTKALQAAGLGNNVELFKFLYGLIDYNRPEYEQYYYEDVVTSAAKGGNLTIIKLLLDTTVDLSMTSNRIAIYGSSVNYDKIVKLLLDSGYKHMEHIMRYAAKNGYIDLIEEMIQLGVDPIHALSGALESNQVDIINKLLQLPILIDDDIIYCAGVGGNFDIIHRLEERQPDFYYNLLLYGSVEEGHVDVVDYAIENGADDFDLAITLANNIDIITKLIPLATNNQIVDAISNRINAGNYNAIELLLDTYEISDGSMNGLSIYAIEKEQTEIAKLLISKLEPSSDMIRILVSAAENGNYDIIIILVDKLQDVPPGRVIIIKSALYDTKENKYYRLTNKLKSYYNV